MEGITELAQTFLGPIVGPDAPDYDVVRKVHNGLTHTLVTPRHHSS
jgi:hypothetical protein